MINELRNIFSRSLKIIITYPQIIRLSLSLIALNTLLILGRISNLVCINGILSLGTVVFSVLLQIYFIFYVYKVEGVLGDDVDIWMKARKYFWKYVFQFIIGFLASVLISFPLTFILILLVQYKESLSQILFLILSQIFFYVNLGAVALSQQVLLHRNLGILKNLRAGLMDLNDYRGYYFLFFIITSLIGGRCISQLSVIASER